MQRQPGGIQKKRLVWGRSFLFLSFSVLFTVFSGNAQKLQVGDTAPVMRFISADNKKISPDFFKGKYLVVDFWATWCAPCIASFPHMNQLKKTVNGNKVEFAIISYEPAAHIKRFFQQRKEIVSEARSLADVPDTVSKALNNEFRTFSFIQYAVTSLPTTFIIDPKGLIQWIGHPKDLSESILNRIIDGNHSAEVQKIQTKISPPRFLTKADTLKNDMYTMRYAAVDKSSNNSMYGPGVAAFRGERIDRILMTLFKFHSKQIDTSLLSEPLPYVQIELRSRQKNGLDTVAMYALEALNKAYTLNNLLETRTYEVMQIRITDVKKLLKKAAAFDPSAGHSGTSVSDKYLFAINSELKALASNHLAYAAPEIIFVWSPDDLKKFEKQKFDFRIPLVSLDQLINFLQKEYGLTCRKIQMPLPTLVLHK